MDHCPTRSAASRRSTSGLALYAVGSLMCLFCAKLRDDADRPLHPGLRRRRAPHRVDRHGARRQCRRRHGARHVLRHDGVHAGAHSGARRSASWCCFLASWRVHLPRLPRAWASSRASGCGCASPKPCRASRRSPLRPGRSLAAAGEVLRNPVTMGYTMAVGLHLRQLHLLSRNLAAALRRAIQPGRLFRRLVRRLRQRRSPWP